jgi:3'-5' exoribonuclease
LAEPQALEGLAEKEPVEAELLVLDKKLQTTKNGTSYLALALGDAGGKIEARIWDRADRLDRLFDSGDVIRFQGRISSYQGRRQVVISELTRVEPKDPDRFLPAARRPVEEMLDELSGIAAGLAPPLKELCQNILGDDKFRELFTRAPAAKSVHHDYLGGLVEHTLSVTVMADLVAGRYPFLHRDLLLTGAILHDAGKALELTLTPAPDYTTTGRLVGHVTLGVNLVRDHLPADFPAGLADEVIHLILSHHGVLEFGSPKLPQTAEAVALNLCDEIDAKLNAVRSIIDQAQGDWSGYDRLFERFFYRGSGDRPPPSPGREGKPKSRAKAGVPKNSGRTSGPAPESENEDEDVPGLFKDL